MFKLKQRCVVDFGELRSVLQGGDTQQTWESLCELMARMGEQEIEQLGPSYIEDHLSRWPARHRIAPQPWVAQLMEGGSAPAALAFARALSLGFVTLTEQQLTTLARSPQLAELRELSLWAVCPKGQTLDLGCLADAQWRALDALVVGACALEPEALKRLLSQPWLSGLTCLGLPGVALDSLDRYAWTPRLERLDLSNNPLGPKLSYTLAQGFERLVELDLSRAGLLGDQLGECFDGLSTLRSLRLSQNPLGAQGALTLAHSLPTQLELLDLHQCALGAEGMSALLVRLPERLSALKILDLSRNSLDDEHVGILSRGFTSLERLELGACGIGGQVAQWLARSEVFNGVRSVGLSHNALGLEGAQALAVEGAFEGVEALTLGYNELDARALEVMLAAGCFDQLKELHLNDNPLGLSGIKALCERWPKQLKTLVLTRCHLKPEAIELLASFEGIASLEELVLQGNMLNDKALGALSEAKALAPSLRERWTGRVKPA